MSNEPDFIDKLIAFLKKREGIDKTLKLVRYSARLLAAVGDRDSESTKRLAAFEKSVGVSRKAYRLGKFLQDYNELRKSKSTGWLAILELVAYGGEGVYFFIEQLVWLIKAGALDKSHEAQLAMLSAWSEFSGYMASICISAIKLRDIQANLHSIQTALDKLKQEQRNMTSTNTPGTSGEAAPPGNPKLAALQRKLELLRAQQVTRGLAVVQDLADSILAVNDIRGGKDPVLNHPVVLAVAGLVSGCISTRKNWIG